MPACLLAMLVHAHLILLSEKIIVPAIHIHPPDNDIVRAALKILFSKYN